MSSPCTSALAKACARRSDGVCMSSVSTGTGCHPCTFAMAHSQSAGQARGRHVTSAGTLAHEVVVEEEIMERGRTVPRHAHEFGVSGSYDLIFRSSLAYTLAAFARPNGNRPCGERGGDSGVHPESWRKTFTVRTRASPRYSLNGWHRA
jgi:hypothetical protein